MSINLGRLTREETDALLIEILCDWSTEESLRETLREVPAYRRDIIHDILTDLEDEE